MSRVDPYEETDVIDQRAPRFNQLVVGVLSLVAVLSGQAWLLGLLALQLFIGLTLGRRYCLQCLFYYEVIQPRLGEGKLEDSRAPRFANMIGFAFLGSATALVYAGVPQLGWASAVTVVALALLAAATNFCAGCEVYKLSARLRGISPRHFSQIDPTEFDLGTSGDVVLEFMHPLCSDCLTWDARLRAEGRTIVAVNVATSPELAHKYGVAYVPTIVVVTPEGLVKQRLAP